MKSCNYKFFYKTVVCILIFCLLLSCQQKKEESESNKDKKEQIPSELKNIDKISEKIIEEIEKMQKEQEKPIKFEINKNQTQKQDNKQQGGNDSSQGGQQQGQQQQQQQPQQPKDKEEQKEEIIIKKEEEMFTKWESLLENIEKIHSAWNDYENQAIKDGATQNDINSFETTLDKLTVAIDEKNDMKTLEKVNDLTLYMAQFLKNYKGNIDAEINVIKFYTRKALLDGKKKEWISSKKSTQDLKPALDRLNQKATLEKKDEKLMDKLNNSINDLEEAINNQNEELLKIKRDIILKNLDAIKEAIK